MINNNYEIYQRAMQFAKNKKSNGGGLSNLYVIQKTDINGNLIDEYYGMNMMTDYGMSQYFVSGNSFPTNIYIGDGTGSFNHTSNSLISPTTINPSTVSDKTISYAYPLYYDKISGLVTCVCKYLTAYFDYNISGITDPISVTEYGLGTAYNALWTHSWVYDITGSQTYITKNINERLTITVFLCFSYYESLITSGYVNDRYTMITTMHRFFTDKMYENNIYTYKRFGTGCTRERTKTSSGFMNNEITRYTNLSPFTMYSGSTTDAGYIDGFCQWSSGFMTLEPQQLDEPDDFDINLRMNWNDHYKNTGLSKRFGEASAASSFTQADISSVSLFNHKTNKWDIPVEFINDPNKSYCETPMSVYFPTVIYYTNNNTVMKMYVYQNIRVDDPIVKLDNELSTVYATNKYWDTSSWVLITDYDNIPEELQTCRYWITPSSSVSLGPIRKSQDFTVISPNGNVEEYSWCNTANGGYPVCDNYEYGWFKQNNTVYVPEHQLKFVEGINGYTSSSSMTYGKWLLTFSLTTTYSLSDMSVLPTIPTAVKVTPLFSSSINCFSNCYRTKSDTGLVCLQSLTTNEANIIDLRNENYNQILINSKLSTCIWDTNYIAYISPDNTSKVKVYDIDTNSDIMEFDIPSDISNVTFMFGHRNHIWITNGSTYSYVLNTDDNTITGCTNNISYTSGLNYVEITCVDDAVVIYKYNETKTTNAYYMKHNDHTVINNLSEFDLGLSYLTNKVTYTLRYVRDNILVLLITMGRYQSSSYGAYNLVIDFGRYLYDGTKSYTYRNIDKTPNLVPFGEFFIEGNKKIPIEHWLSHRIIGTTRTISTVNDRIKNVSGKQWSTTITNIPEFTGLPPGSVQ